MAHYWLSACTPKERIETVTASKHAMDSIALSWILRIQELQVSCGSCCLRLIGLFSCQKCCALAACVSKHAARAPGATHAATGGRGLVRSDARGSSKDLQLDPTVCHIRQGSCHACLLGKGAASRPRSPAAKGKIALCHIQTGNQGKQQQPNRPHTVVKQHCLVSTKLQ